MSRGGLGRTLFGALDLTMAVLQVGAKTYQIAKRLVRGLRGKKTAPTDQTEPVPLTQRAAANRQSPRS